MDGVIGAAQAIGLILAALGFSAGPWIVGLLTGRLMTRSQHLDRVGDLKEALTRADARADVEHERAEVERQRADRAVDTLQAVAGEMGRTTVHMLRQLPQPPEDGS